MNSYWIKVVAFTHIADYLLSRGIEPADFVRRCGLPALSILETDLWIERGRCLDVCNKLARLVGDPFFGLHIANLTSLGVYGRWGDVIMCSSNVERAICSAVDNIGMIESGRRLSLVKERGCATFRSDFEGTVHSDPHELFEATPLIMKKILGRASEEIPVEVHLPIAQPQDTSEFERLLGPDLVFNADAPALVFDADALTLPLRVPELTGNRRRPMDPASIVREAVRNMQDILDLKRPSAIDVADSLGVTLRTMQRKLKLWGTTYEELLAEFLMLRAAHDLRLNGHSVTDVAFNLGYSDSGHFARAFKRWTGCTPRDFQASELIPLSPLQSIVLEQGIATQQPG